MKVEKIGKDEQLARVTLEPGKVRAAIRRGLAPFENIPPIPQGVGFLIKSQGRTVAVTGKFPVVIEYAIAGDEDEDELPTPAESADGPANTASEKPAGEPSAAAVPSLKALPPS